MIDVALALIVLHDPDGRVVLLNPDSIVSMRADTGKPNELLQMRIRCAIATYDGKLVNVVESCDEIRGLIKGGAQ